jgi:hypothetical protein
VPLAKLFDAVGVEVARNILDLLTGDFGAGHVVSLSVEFCGEGSNLTIGLPKQGDFFSKLGWGSFDRGGRRF